MEIKRYIELNINQRINYKSGWDIVTKYEGRKGLIPEFPNRPYCKLAICLEARIPLKVCQKDYNDCQNHRFLNGGRMFVKQSF